MKEPKMSQKLSIPSSTKDVENSVKELRSSLSLKQFVSPSEPWLLVPDGSMCGIFHWVPKSLRVGPWSPVAPLYAMGLCATAVYTMPPLSTDHRSFSYPELCSALWYYNVFFSLWGIFVLCSFAFSALGPLHLSTFTIQSWALLTLRHGLSAIAPILPWNHALLFFHEILRFPVLVTASTTFVIWNFMIVPAVYTAVLDTRKKQKMFLNDFILNYRFLSVHVLNLFLAITNVIGTSSSHQFEFKDLWAAMTMLVAYSLFYLLVLDRIGMHPYFMFSPRTSFCVVSWSALFGSYYGCFIAWNKIISTGLLSTKVYW